MSLKTKRMICLLIGIASILTIIGTVSYAYFTATTEVKPVDADLSTAKISLVFDDFDDGITAELNFGEHITKKFTLENTGTVETTVKMNWKDLINTYVKGSLTYTLSYSTEENGTYKELVSNEDVPRTPVPMALNTLLTDITIPAGVKYYYDLEVTLNYLEEVNQDTDLKARFYSHFEIKNLNETNEPDFAEPAVTDEGVFEMEDDYGTSYYFRGAVENNYVQFAGFYWRIIRVNGDGSLRIIYDGTAAHPNGEYSLDRSTHQNVSFNSSMNDAKYVGYMYGPAGSSASPSKEEAQSNEADSTIKTVVDQWYKTNIEDAGYGIYVSDTLFCNDRSTPGKEITGWSGDTGLGYGTKLTGYGAFGRLWDITRAQPTFKCPQKSDAFTVEDTIKGNGALTYPVGLITADEVATAGAINESQNTQFYLYRYDWAWTMSPYSLNTKPNAGAFSFGCTNYALGGSTVNNSRDSYYARVVPVINLTSEYASTMSGNGTMTDPYRAE